MYYYGSNDILVNLENDVFINAEDTDEFMDGYIDGFVEGFIVGYIQGQFELINRLLSEGFSFESLEKYIPDEIKLFNFR